MEIGERGSFGGVPALDCWRAKRMAYSNLVIHERAAGSAIAPIKLNTLMTGRFPAKAVIQILRTLRCCYVLEAVVEKGLDIKNVECER